MGAARGTDVSDWSVCSSALWELKTHAGTESVAREHNSRHQQVAVEERDPECLTDTDERRRKIPQPDPLYFCHFLFVVEQCETFAVVCFFEQLSFSCRPNFFFFFFLVKPAA